MKSPITPKGYSALKEDLQRLKAQRPEVARSIEIARGHGDLSENADYDAAKNKSGLLEAKIRDLEARLAMSEVIDPAAIKVSDRVVFGTVVTVSDVDSGDERTLNIVGEYESNVDAGQISLSSPLGRALIGRRTGDVVRVHTPGGVREYEILSVMSMTQE